MVIIPELGGYMGLIVFNLLRRNDIVFDILHMMAIEEYPEACKLGLRSW